MNRWTYYSPLLVGVVLVLAVNDALRESMLTYQPWQQWSIIGLIALVAGVQCQVLMVGAQGAFAQVMPVLGGRSIRGHGAVLAGWMLIGWGVLSSVAALLGFEAVTTAAIVVGVVALASLAGAIVVYVWNLPAAVDDFGYDRRTRA